MVVSFKLLRGVLPQEEMVLLHLVVLPQSLLMVLLSLLELSDKVVQLCSSVESELVMVPLPKVLSSSLVSVLVSSVSVPDDYCYNRGRGSRCSIGGLGYG